jgi:hypothetical protein
LDKTARKKADVPQQLSIARRELDLEKFGDSLNRCTDSHFILSREKEDWLPWTTLHAISASCLIGQGTVTNEIDKEKIQDALGNITCGLQADSHTGDAIRKALPDRYARLIEIRGTARALMASIKGTPVKEAKLLMQSASKDWAEAIKTAQTPLFQASAHCAAAEGYKHEGIKTKNAIDGNDKELLKQGHQHAIQAIELSKNAPAGRLIFARSQLALAVILICQTDLTTGPVSEESDKLARASKLLQTAKSIFEELVPSTSYTQKVSESEELLMIAYKMRIEHTERMLNAKPASSITPTSNR